MAMKEASRKKAISSKQENTMDSKDKGKRKRVNQTDFPQLSLEKALRIAQCLYDNFAGKSAAPHQIAMALDFAPTSGHWRNLCGTSIAYGLTEGGYNADEIILTSLGRKIIAPEEGGDDVIGKAESILQPRIMKEFFEKYNKNKFPRDDIAENVLVTLGLPKERASVAVDILKENGSFTGVIQDTKTGLFVALDSPRPPMAEKSENDLIYDDPQVEIDDSTEKTKLSKINESEKPPESAVNNRVYVSHGKNRKIAAQLKPILEFGKFEPVISVEQETTAKPVPEKVFDDMRSCSAAVIHVDKEAELKDEEGNKHIKINDNVLIEIGAAIALYKKKFILLVQKGVSLPSNLQGLYKCEYEGDILDSDATMKLLKTFNEFS